MTTTDGAPEVWRVECEGGEAREVPVRSRAVLLGGRVQTLYEAGEGDASVERLTARAAVVGLASFEGWPVVAVLAPGEPTRAEVASWIAATEAEARIALDEMHRRVEAAEAEVARWRGDETVANLVALRAAVQRHREAVEREQDEATTRAELFAVADECHASLTVREPATQAERNLDTASGLLGAALVCLAAERAYRETEGRPWAERIAARKVADEARATLARMMGGES